MAEHSAATTDSACRDIRDGDTLLGTISLRPRQKRACPSDVWVACDTQGREVGGAPRPSDAAALLRRHLDR